MFVQQKTLPWIPGQASGGASNYRRRNARRRARGMGAVQLVDFPFLASAPGTDTGSLVPCLAGSGPLADGQSYCPPAATSTTDNWDSKTSAAVASVCFQPLFPFVGQQSADGSCIPVIAVKDPWPLWITVGLGAFLGFKLLGGR